MIVEDEYVVVQVQSGISQTIPSFMLIIEK